ncbi:hypothetical protein SDC9_132238 [bioreactor metagenome]|uniref:Uncharacterized protein n=1 Tax=bioreactor metagenome TaxID=1076179 RepID=A0A645D6L3_9ZZZZ
MLASAARPGFLFGHSDRGAAQVLDPRQGAAAWLGGRGARLYGLEQGGGDMLAVATDCARTAADDSHLAALVLAQVGLDLVGLGCRPGYLCAEHVAVDVQVADQVDVGFGLVDVARGEPVGDMFFGKRG